MGITTFNIQNSMLCPPSVSVCFVMISKPAATFSPWSINWLDL